MFYCLHSFIDPLGAKCYMITRPLGMLQTIYVLCGKVSQLETKYYFSHCKELPMMGRKIPYEPPMQNCTQIEEQLFIEAMY